eukprot:TRINITY_DN1969_c0_g1_i4.p1 TRINITY_DN1969_c0_g1~~TRINITY_DN1969_c0_g1_i4.p1  ORF type:complete len:228 (-),score=35.44 TRINITY_DN1969_c0_g1_i4:55-738(-)
MCIRDRVTGGSVIGLYFKDGVILASDTLLSYGSMAKFRDVRRAEKINDTTAIASSGEYSDFQEVMRKINNMHQEELNANDNIKFSPSDYTNYLARLCYFKRNKGNPYYMVSVIGGYQNGQRYLGYVDLHGTHLEDTHIVTGFATYFCKPLLWNYWKEDQDEQQVKRVLIECFKVLAAKQTTAQARIQFTVIDKNGVRIEEAQDILPKWDFKFTLNRASEKLYSESLN